MEVKISRHSIKCKDGRQVRAAQLIKQHLPRSFIADKDFEGIVFFAQPKNRLAIALRKSLDSTVQANLEGVGIRLIKYTFWDSGMLSGGVFEY